MSLACVLRGEQASVDDDHRPSPSGRFDGDVATLSGCESRASLTQKCAHPSLVRISVSRVKISGRTVESVLKENLNYG